MNNITNIALFNAITAIAAQCGLTIDPEAFDERKAEALINLYNFVESGNASVCNLWYECANRVDHMLSEMSF